MDLKFELPTTKRKKEAIEYIKEFIKHDSLINGTGGLDINDYDNWVTRKSDSHSGKPETGRVPSSTYFVIDESRDRIVGMINIRHNLNEYLIVSGSGHIGYSVRPTERRKGYAKEMLRRGLIILNNDYNVEEGLFSCFKHNIGSKTVILRNGGVYQRSYFEEDNTESLVFTIDLKNK